MVLTRAEPGYRWFSPFSCCCDSTPSSTKLPSSNRPLPNCTSCTMGNAMNGEPIGVCTSVSSSTPADRVTLSPWVNEPPLPWSELLSAHDVARLTRRPKWLLHSLALIGRFPKQRCFRGRRVGWLRADVLDWMSRGLTAEPSDQERESSVRFCARKHPRQPCLPLECHSGCVAPRDHSRLRPAASCNTRRGRSASEQSKHDR